MSAALVVWPLLGVVWTLVVPSTVARRAGLLVVAVGHAVLTALVIARPAWGESPGWLGLDPLGLLFLATTSTIFLVVAFYVVGYLAREDRDNAEDRALSEVVFIACLLGFLAMMTLVTVT